MEKNSQNSSEGASKDCSISPEEKKFILERLRSVKINAEQRIHWIDDAWEMLRHARKTVK